MVKKIIIVTILLCFAKDLWAPEPPGLPNQGNTCYMNALLQCLYNVRPLTELLVNRFFIYPKDSFGFYYQKLIRAIEAGKTDEQLKPELKNFYTYVDAHMEQSARLDWFDDLIEKLKDGRLTHASLMQTIADEVKKEEITLENSEPEDKEAQEEKVATLQNIKARFDLVGNTATVQSDIQLLEEVKTEFIKSRKKLKQLLYHQHDASEFFVKLFDQIIKDSPADKKKTIENFFEVGSRSSLQCPNGNRQPTLERLNIIQVPVQASKGKILTRLTKCLDAYFAPEIVELSGQNCTKQLSLQRASDFLVINLKRFESYLKNGRQKLKRLDHAVDIPFDLDISAYIVGHPQALYELIGIVIQRGALSGGHYTDYVKNQFEPTGWYYCNDDRITAHGQPQQSDFNQDAYMLFYKKHTPESMLRSNLRELAQDLDALAGRLKLMH